MDGILLHTPGHTTVAADGKGGKLRRWLTAAEEAALRAEWWQRRHGQRLQPGADGLLLPSPPPPGEGLREDFSRLLRDGALGRK